MFYTVLELCARQVFELFLMMPSILNLYLQCVQSECEFKFIVHDDAEITFLITLN